MTCAKCQSPMQEGFQLDNTYGGRVPAEWIEGEPQHSIWVGLKIGDRDHRKITVYRCTQCGFLESYAR